MDARAEYRSYLVLPIGRALGCMATRGEDTQVASTSAITLPSWFPSRTATEPPSGLRRPSPGSAPARVRRPQGGLLLRGVRSEDGRQQSGKAPFDLRAAGRVL